MKILLVTTGGTIASGVCDGVIDVSDSTKLLVLEKYKQLDNDTQFDVISPVNILSENVSADDYKLISRAVLGIDYDGYDGVIVTHGSDTLSYTSALLSFLLSNVQKPVCVVASDKALCDEKSNGLDNFVAAVQVIKSGKTGVFVPYRNSDMVTYIHKANELLESSVYSNDFYSVNGAYGVYKNGILDFCDEKQGCEKRYDTKKFNLEFDKNIVMVHPYVMLDYNTIDIKNADCVLHLTYHAGSVCANGEHTNIRQLIKKCEQRDIPLYICGLSKNKANYNSMSSILSDKVSVLYDMSPACCYMKIMLEG